MYRVLDLQHRNMNVIELTEGDFAGVQFVVGEISFDAEQEGLIHYDLEVLTGEEVTQPLADAAGTVVADLLEKMIANQEVIFKGGV